MNKGVRDLLHYFDDFIFVSNSLEEASTNKQILVDTFNHLGIFLEFEVDTRTLQIRLPSNKLLCLMEGLSAAVLIRCLSKYAL